MMCVFDRAVDYAGLDDDVRGTVADMAVGVGGVFRGPPNSLFFSDISSSEYVVVESEKATEDGKHRGGMNGMGG
jgi:hypothetical protein